MIKVEYDEGQEINYTYDAAGNLLSVTATGIEPMFTEIILEGTAGNNEWYKSDVKVNLTVHSGGGGRELELPSTALTNRTGLHIPSR